MTQVAPHSGHLPRETRRHRHAAGVPAPAPSNQRDPGPNGLDHAFLPPGPAPSRGSTDTAGPKRRGMPPRGRHATSYGQNFARVVGWTLLGSLLPGTGLIAAGRRTGGLIAVTAAHRTCILKRCREQRSSRE